VNYDIPHRRYNPLIREWVLVSPHRAKRPWLGQVEKTPPENLPPYDPTCYLCPGNSRAGGRQNSPYTSTYIFDNDFPALLLPEGVGYPTQDSKGEKSGNFRSQLGGAAESKELFLAKPESGICRVVCFSPRHDLSLPELSQEAVEAVVNAWKGQTSELSNTDFIQYVQVFENKGAMMGASNPHPHSQIWATSYVPNEPAKEITSLVDYQRQHGSCLLCDTLAAELEDGERLVSSNESFIAVVPYWAVWPFEILVISRRHTAMLTELDLKEIAGLADLLRRITARYDNLFEISFPYSMGFHQAPTDGTLHVECHLHAHFYPPLLRSATVRKFMVGFEMLGMPQRDLTPETAAEKLRSMSEIHYKEV
jgi:UDPglucose--hexose-1-phosphate uridylyltransferase